MSNRRLRRISRQERDLEADSPSWFEPHSPQALKEHVCGGIIAALLIGRTAMAPGTAPALRSPSDTTLLVAQWERPQEQVSKGTTTRSRSDGQAHPVEVDDQSQMIEVKPSASAVCDGRMARHPQRRRVPRHRGQRLNKQTAGRAIPFEQDCPSGIQALRPR